MRKLKFFEHMSLDGVIQVAGSPGEGFTYGDWTAPFRSPEGLATVLDLQGENFDLLLGRRTYDIWSRYWPLAPKSPMADRLNAATKFVVTHRAESLSWGPFASVATDLVSDVRRIKEQGSRDLILWGSSTLTSTLLEHGLVDELCLFVYPVLLGHGKRLFALETPARGLRLKSSKALPSGIVIQS